MYIPVLLEMRLNLVLLRGSRRLRGYMRPDQLVRLGFPGAHVNGKVK